MEVSKLVYNPFRGLIAYLYSGYNPFTKYHGHPSRYHGPKKWGVPKTLPHSGLTQTSPAFSPESLATLRIFGISPWSDELVFLAAHRSRVNKKPNGNGWVDPYFEDHPSYSKC